MVMPCVVRLKIPGTSIMLKCSCVGLDTSKRGTSSENVRRKGTVSDPIPIAIVTFNISFMTYSGQTTYLLHDITKRSRVEQLKELSTVKTLYNDMVFYAVRIVIPKVSLYSDFVRKTH